MIDQPSLLDHPDILVEEVHLPAMPYAGNVPRVAGSDTSIAAAESMVPKTGRMQAEILRLLKGYEYGRTCDEIEAITGWSHQSASARIRELVLAELVVDSGDRRKGRSGRSGRVYRLAP